MVQLSELKVLIDNMLEMYGDGDVLLRDFGDEGYNHQVVNDFSLKMAKRAKDVSRFRVCYLADALRKRGIPRQDWTPEALLEVWFEMRGEPAFSLMVNGPSYSMGI